MRKLSLKTLPISKHLKIGHGNQRGGQNLNNSTFPIYFDNIKNKYFIVDNSIRKDITINDNSSISVVGSPNSGRLINNSGENFTLPPGSTTIPINTSIQPTSTTSLYTNISAVVVPSSTPPPPAPPPPPPQSIPVLPNDKIINLQPIIKSLKYLDGLGISTSNDTYNSLLRQFKAISNFDYFKTYVLPSPSLENLPVLTTAQMTSLRPIVTTIKNLERLETNKPNNPIYSTNIIQFKNIAGFNYFSNFVLADTLTLSPETYSEVSSIINQINYLNLPPPRANRSGGSLSPSSEPSSAASSLPSPSPSPSLSPVASLAPSPSTNEDLFDKFRRITGLTYSKKFLLPLTQNQVTQLQPTLTEINNLKRSGFNIKDGSTNDTWLRLMLEFLNKARFDYYDGFVLSVPIQGISEPPPRQLSNLSPLQLYYLRSIMYNINYLRGHGHNLESTDENWQDTIRKFRIITGFDYTMDYVLPTLSIKPPSPDKLTEEEMQQLAPVMLDIFDLIDIHGQNLQRDEYELDRFVPLQNFHSIAGYSYYTGFVLPPKQYSSLTDSEKRSLFNILLNVSEPTNVTGRSVYVQSYKRNYADAFYRIHRRFITSEDIANRSRLYHKEYLELVQDQTRVSQLIPIVIAMNDFIRYARSLPLQYPENFNPLYPKFQTPAWSSYLHEFRIRAGFDYYNDFTLPNMPSSTSNEQLPGTIAVTIPTIPPRVLYLLPPNPVITPLAAQNLRTSDFTTLTMRGENYRAFVISWDFDNTASATDHFMIHYGEYSFGPVDFLNRSYDVIDIPSNYTANLYITTHLNSRTTNSQSISVRTLNVPRRTAGSPFYPTRLTVEAATTSTVNIRWTHSGMYNNFDIIYGPYRIERLFDIHPNQLIYTDTQTGKIIDNTEGNKDFRYQLTDLPPGYTNTLYIVVNLRDESGVNHRTQSSGLVVSTLPGVRNIRDLTASELEQLRTVVTTMRNYNRVGFTMDNTANPDFNNAKSIFKTILHRDHDFTNDINILNDINTRIESLLSPSPPPSPPKNISDLTLSELNQLTATVIIIRKYNITNNFAINNTTNLDFNSAKNTFKAILNRDYDPTNDANILNSINSRIPSPAPRPSPSPRPPPSPSPSPPPSQTLFVRQYLNISPGLDSIINEIIRLSLRGQTVSRAHTIQNYMNNNTGLVDIINNLNESQKRAFFTEYKFLLNIPYYTTVTPERIERDLYDYFFGHSGIDVSSVFPIVFPPPAPAQAGGKFNKTRKNKVKNIKKTKKK